MKKGTLKKITSSLVALAMMVSIIIPSTAIKANAAEGKTFNLVEITDFHGSLESSSGQPVAGVLAKDIKDIKTANPDRTLVLSGGDLYQGTPISNVLYGVPVQKVMSNIGVEVSAIGNHEFDWGINTITDKTMKGAAYSLIAANIYDKTTGKRAFDPYKIIVKDGVRIAVIGATTPSTVTKVLPKYVENYEFKDIATEVNSVAKQIRDNKEADVVIALMHEGSNLDCKTGPVFDITNKLVGVDAVFGGDSHTIVNSVAANGIPIYVGNNAGKGYIDAKMTIGSDGKPTFEGKYVAIDTTEANGYKAATPSVDSEVKAIVDAAKTEIGPMFNEVIGKADQDLTRTQDETPYGESFLGNWTTDCMRAEAKADVAFQNNGGLRINIPAGDITVGTIFTFMPFDNEIVASNMTKAQIKVVLEQAVASNGKGVQLSGLKVKYDTTKPDGDRVVSITREDGTPISDTETLRVATNDFMATGGDGFTGFVAAGFSTANVIKAEAYTHILVRDALVKNVRANGKITATMNNRLVNTIKSITVLGTSDVHGSVLPYDYATGKAADLGLAKVSTYVNTVRASNPNVVLIDAGDTIQGTPLSYYYDKVDTTSEYPLMKVMGAMKYDSWTLGNHEFNYGLTTLNRVIADATKEGISVLSANTYKEDNSNYVKPYITKSFTVNGKTIKVGILGLTTKCIPNWENKDNYAGLKFNDLVDEAKKWTPILKNEEKCDVIIASIHSGEETPSDTIPENQIKAIATSTSGIDAILCGHAHEIIPGSTKPYIFTTIKNAEGKDVVISEPGKSGQAVSQFDINVNEEGKVVNVTSKLVKIDSTIASDKNIEAIIKPYQDKTLEYVNTVIGASTDEFSGKDQTTNENALMNLINKVQMTYAKTQLSIAAPLSSSAYIPKGDITIKDISSVYVFENFLYGVKMNGKQIKDWMEYSMKYYKQEPADGTGKIEKDTALNVPDYNLDVLYGATYDVDLTQPVGQRIKNLKYNGITINDTDEFTVAINNYRFNGGGGFMAQAGLKPGDTSIVTYDSSKELGDDGQVRNLMIDYITKAKTISPEVPSTPNWSLSTKTVEIKADPTVEPTVEPTAEPTVKPTAKPVKKPTVKPVKKPVVKAKVISITSKKGSKVRIAPNTKAKVIGNVKFGTKLQLIKVEGKWYRVKFNKKNGFVPKTEAK